MCKLQYNRVFRFLVCLVLVLSLLVNLSPLKAEATAVVAGALTFEGLMAALYSMGIGIVATHYTVELWNKIGNSLGQAITETGDDTITEAWIDLEAMYDAYVPGGGQDPDDELEWAEKLKHALSRGLLGAIAGWLCTLVNIGGYEVEGDAAATGWTYYGDLLLPTFPSYDGFSYILVLTTTPHNYRVIHSSAPIYYNSVSTDFVCASDTNFMIDTLLNSDYVNWNINSSYKSEGPYNKSAGGSVKGMYWNNYAWSNYNILSYSDSSLVYAGSLPSSSKTEIIEPSIYVGDIPQQIQDGEKDKDNLVLPIIDPFRVIQSPETALDDVNQLQQQLANGTTTLDQYLEQVTYQEPTQPDNPSTDPTSPTSPSVDPDPWEPPEDPGKFALDLSKVFPFCIPFDLYAFLTCLNADPVTPVIHWEIAMPGGGSYPLTIDLSPFNSVAQLLRRLELLLFCIALAMKTRDLIKG